MQPLGDRILAKEITETTLPSGIIIPDSIDDYNKPHPRAKVLAVGVRCSDEIQVGDVVYYSKNTGYPVDIDGEELIFIREGNILYRD